MQTVRNQSPDQMFSMADNFINNAFNARYETLPLYFQTQSEVESFFLNMDRIFASDLYWNENYIHPYIKVQVLRGK
jgi:hypothetical protein